MKAFRLNRIFERGSGLFIGVAFEEDFLSSHDVLSGLQSMRSVSATGIDVVEVSVSQALAWRSITTKGAVILNAGDVGASTFPKACGGLVEQALRLDAAGIAAQLGKGDLVTESKNIAFLKEKCDRYGLPLMIDVSSAEGNSSQISLAKRALGIGADLIKADLTDDGSRISDVISGIPLIADISEEAALRNTSDFARAGACGLILRRSLMASRTARMQILEKIRSGKKALATAAKLKRTR